MKPGAESEAVMKKMTRNLTLSAAALAALVAFTPSASAQFPLPPTPHQVSQMWHARHDGYYNYHYSHRYYVPYARHYYYPSYHVYSGYRFYAYSPGPGYVYVNGYGWCYPPYAGAVWVPGHYGHGHVWISARFG